MSDEVDLSTDTLRRMYGQALTQASRAVEPEHMVAWAALAALTAELRAALGEAGVIAQAEAPVQAGSPWRSVATDPPEHGRCVLVGYLDDAAIDLGYSWWPPVGWKDSDGDVISPPNVGMPIPPLPEVAS